MSELTREEFDVLATQDEPNGAVHGTWEDASEGAKAALIEKGFTDTEGHITALGLKALEPHRARRAVMLASGFGSRMLPITINTPKPLVRVKGRRIIDSLLDALVAVGVEEIYVVRGYLGELFDQLLYKYPTITTTLLTTSPRQLKRRTISKTAMPLSPTYTWSTLTSLPSTSGKQTTWVCLFQKRPTGALLPTTS